MKLYEYQAKSVFQAYGIPTEKHYLCFSPQDVVEVFKSNHLDKAVLKAQVLTGGRGKAGGVKLVKSIEEAELRAKEIFGMQIKNLSVHQLLVSEAIEIKKEYYVSITLDRTTKSMVLILSASGGMDIEQVAKETPEKVLKFPIDPFHGIFDFQAKEYAYYLSSDIKEVNQIASILKKLYHLFVEKDASLAEINPLVLCGDGKVLAIDGKMDIDNNAKYRQPEIVSMYKPSGSEIIEEKAKEKGFSYVQLDGDIGCMVNGAGLAMTTMDMIQLYGGKPANFLDIGGSSNPQKVIDAMEILVSDPNVKSVLINIFGGITRCDDVARGLQEAFKTIKVDIPVIVRLTGTNEELGRAMLKDTPLTVAQTMDEATELAVKASR